MKIHKRMKEAFFFEPMIGEVFDFDGTEVKCVEDDENSIGCFSCHRRKEGGGCYNPMCYFLCKGYQREDRKDVHFEEEKG